MIGRVTRRLGIEQEEFAGARASATSVQSPAARPAQEHTDSLPVQDFIRTNPVQALRAAVSGVLAAACISPGMLRLGKGAWGS